MEEWSNMDRGKMLVKSVAKLGNLERGGDLVREAVWDWVAL